MVKPVNSEILWRKQGLDSRADSVFLTEGTICKQYVMDGYATSKANCREDVGVLFPPNITPYFLQSEAL